jgi:hypothetical protein
MILCPRHRRKEVAMRKLPAAHWPEYLRKHIAGCAECRDRVIAEISRRTGYKMRVNESV